MQDEAKAAIASFQYSVQVMLPAEIEETLRQWAERTPGATWPEWGGHISLVNLFVPIRGIQVIKGEIADICQAFSPFQLCLDQVAVEIHWRRPHLQTVLLKACDKTTPGYRTLVRLRDSLVAALGPLKRDVAPEVSQRPFDPHLSLTWGLEDTEAERLASAARQAGLRAEFIVEKIWLIAFLSLEPGVHSKLYERHPFRLGAPRWHAG